MQPPERQDERRRNLRALKPTSLVHFPLVSRKNDLILWRIKLICARQAITFVRSKHSDKE